MAQAAPDYRVRKRAGKLALEVRCVVCKSWARAQRVGGKSGRIYCGSACMQRAYRQRQTAKARPFKR